MKSKDQLRQMPDINTLIAAAWPNHIHHLQARRWLETETQSGWATCPIVQSGFLRISMNAAVVGHAATFATALALLEQYTSDTAHTFWESEASPSVWPEWLQQRFQGYRQVTDATLLATALQNNGILVTMNGGLLTLLPESHRSRSVMQTRRRSKPRPLPKTLSPGRSGATIYL